MRGLSFSVLFVGRMRAKVPVVLAFFMFSILGRKRIETGQLRS